MSTDNDKPGSEDAATPMDWILESCFLDLLVDEEEPEDLKNWARDRGWQDQFISARNGIRNVCHVEGTQEDLAAADGDAYWPFKGSVTRAEINKFDTPSLVAKWFLQMKAARARATIDCNRTRYEYAQLPDKAGSQSVSKALLVVRNTLNAIILDSLAAFAWIPRNPDEAMKEKWSVLAALFHSEVCASGTTEDVSYGMARAFDPFFPSGPRLPWRPLFQLISTHNQARGLSHQHNDVACIHLLEPLLEDFDSQMEDAVEFLPLAVRLVFFPAVFTLAESLKDCHRTTKDCHRTTEAARWLKLAGDKRLPEHYWKSRLNVELSLLQFPEGQASLTDRRIPPKLMNEDQHRIYITNEMLISNTFNTLNKLKTKVLDNYTSKWAEALTWTIRWHEGDRFTLLGTIQGAALSVQAVSAALEQGLNNEKCITYDLCLNNVMKVLESLRQAINNNSKYSEFQFLSPDKKSADLQLTMREGINMWRPLKLLMPALEETVNFLDKLRIKKPEFKQKVIQSKSGLVPWLKTLRRRLDGARKRKCFVRGPLFVDVASDQQVYKLLQNPAKLCPANPAKHRRENCNNFPNCVKKALQLRELGKSRVASTVASTPYLLNRMSRTEAEFTRFLESPSPDLRSDQKGPVTPWTEFISLRRWNSFSPNLASRATTTVGGGYLVRIWDNKLGKNGHGEHIGIAIDPGYNYLENLFDEGFTLPDLHVVVVTHAHPDHVENLSNIFTLLRERESRIRKMSRIFLVLTEGVFERFKTLIDNEMDFIHDVVVLSWARPVQGTVYVVKRRDQSGNGGSISLTMVPEPNTLASIQAIHAIHSDGTDFDSMGLVVQVMNQREDNDLRIGFTGDTRYWDGLCAEGKFAECDILVPHLGSVIGSKAFSNSHEYWNLSDNKNKLKRALGQLQLTLKEKNHLYLPGISMLLCDLTEELKKLKRTRTKAKKTPPLILLSEFGEELRGGLRADLAKRLEDVFQIKVLPVDVGLRVGVKDQSVRCAICRQYVSAGHTKPVAVSDEDEALVFVCTDCCQSRQHELPMLLSRIRSTPPEPHRTNAHEGISGS